MQLDPKSIFARNLKRLRTAAGLSQEELAGRAGLHRTYISSVEHGNRNVSIENIYAIAKALGSDPRELLTPAPDDADGGSPHGLQD